METNLIKKLYLSMMILALVGIGIISSVTAGSAEVKADRICHLTILK